MALDDVTRFVDATLDVAIRHREEELVRLRQEIDRLRASRRALAGEAARTTTGTPRQRQPSAAIKTKRAAILNVLANEGELATPEVAKRLGLGSKAALAHLKALEGQDQIVQTGISGHNHAKIWKLVPAEERPPDDVGDLTAALLPRIGHPESENAALPDESLLPS